MIIAGATTAVWYNLQSIRRGEWTLYRSVSVTQAKRMIEETASILILDVRTTEEYEKNHLRAAVNLPLSYFPSWLTDLSTRDRNKIILVYCQAGGRSAKASDALVELGFTSIYNMRGGIAEWIDAGYPIVNGTQRGCGCGGSPRAHIFV